MDLFGNRVDSAGASFDSRGNPVNISKYFISEEKLKEDHQRNEEYVKMLGEKIVENYFTHNIIMTSHLVSFTAFEMIRKRNMKLDVFGILRLPPEDSIIPFDDFYKKVEQLKNILAEMVQQNRIRLTNNILYKDIDSVIQRGIEKVGMYHDRRPLEKTKTGDICSPDLKLLYFYHNRLAGYDLEKYF
jgi:glycerol-3-phosphate O-acyltransferase